MFVRVIGASPNLFLATFLAAFSTPSLLGNITQFFIKESSFEGSLTQF